MNLKFLIIGVFIYCAGFGQASTNRNFHISVQPYVGGFSTKLIDTIGVAYVSDFPNYRWVEAGIFSKIMWSFKNLNVGGGIGINKKIVKPGIVNTITPSFFGSIEVGNGKKLNNISIVLNSGIIFGSIEDKYSFFVSGGPKINFGSNRKNVNYAINPFFLIHGYESEARISYDRSTVPGTPYPYIAVFETTLIGVSFVIEFNTLKAIQRPDEQL